MHKDDSLGDRMKGYENAYDYRLTNRLPVILRLDGNSFSKLTKKMKLDKPFDAQFHKGMIDTARRVLQYCSGAQVAYVQSDEISILLRNDMTIHTDPFLANRLQKLCSLTAATASVEFSSNSWIPEGGAMFDCRAFVLPNNEVNNYFLWRQRDAFRNAVQGVCYYGLAERHGRKTAQGMMHGLGINEQQELIYQELGFNMNDYPVKYKRGVCLNKVLRELPIEELLGEERAKELDKVGEIVVRSKWEVDNQIPMFDNEPKYIERYLK